MWRSALNSRGHEVPEIPPWAGLGQGGVAREGEGLPLLEREKEGLREQRVLSSVLVVSVGECRNAHERRGRSYALETSNTLC